MLPIRIKACSESDLRMLGDLAHNIQRVLPVTQADIDAAAALGKGWVVWKVIEVTDPIDNLRGGTQLVIKQNSITPGQNVRRVLIVQGPGGETVVIGPGPSPLLLPDAVADSLSYVKAFGGTEQRNLPSGYIQLEYIESNGTQYIDTGVYISTGYKVRVKAYATSVPTSIAFFGCTTTADASNAHKGIFRIIGASINRCAWGDGSGSVAGSLTGNDSANTWYDMVCDNGVWTINDTLFATCPEVSFTSEYSMWLFARNTGGTVGLPASCRISVCQIWDNNGQMIRNFVPAKNSSNVVGMYDTVSGQFLTNQGTGDFVAGDPVVPTPTAPIPITCNNGVLKARHQSGLPLGYTLLDYITSTGTQYIDTGINQTTLVKPRIITKYKITVSEDKDWFGGSNDDGGGIIWNIAPNTTRIAYIRWKTQSTRGITFESGYSVSDLVFLSDFHTLDVGGVEESGVVPIIVDNNLIGNMDSTTTLNWVNHNLLIFRSGRSGQNGTCLFSYFTIYSNDVKVWDGVACRRNSDNVLGMYDLVSGQFFTNAGTGTFTAGNPVSDPVEIYTDGTVETIKDSLNNTATAEMLLKVGDYQDVQSIIDGVVTRNVGIKVLDGTENFETATATNCYSLTNTLGTGNFADRTIVCSHFASTPTMPDTGDRQGLAFIVNKGAEYTIAFGATTQFSTQALWQQFLAEQYAAGTPVIVIYPLATATTESVAGQTLQVTDGDNVLEITQASLSTLELEAEYQKSV